MGKNVAQKKWKTDLQFSTAELFKINLMFHKPLCSGGFCEATDQNKAEIIMKLLCGSTESGSITYWIIYVSAV